QVKRIVDNDAHTITVEGDFDVLPDTTSSFVISGFTAPANTGNLNATVTGTTTDSVGRTVLQIAAGGVPRLPGLQRGGRTGAAARIIGATGAANCRTIASNTANTNTLIGPWIIANGTAVVITQIPGTSIDSVPVPIHDGDTPGVVIQQSG